MTRHALYLITAPARICWLLARECSDSLACAIGLRWRDSRGRTHWKDSLR
jgi:hypothetical protein